MGETGEECCLWGAVGTGLIGSSMLGMGMTVYTRGAGMLCGAKNPGSNHILSCSFFHAVCMYVSLHVCMCVLAGRRRVETW